METMNESNKKRPVLTDDPTLSSMDGLLWRNGQIIKLPEADRVAKEHGFNCAEELVRYLSNKDE
jgi:hypothetical protein